MKQKQFIKEILRNTSFSKKELIGILLQIIPFILCLFTYHDEQKILWLIPRTVSVSIKPDLLSTFFAVLLYLVLSIRLELFKKEKPYDCFISIVALILNVLVIASLFSIIINSDFKFAGIENFGYIF